MNSVLPQKAPQGATTDVASEASQRDFFAQLAKLERDVLADVHPSLSLPSSVIRNYRNSLNERDQPSTATHSAAAPPKRTSPNAPASQPLAARNQSETAQILSTNPEPLSSAQRSDPVPSTQNGRAELAQPDIESKRKRIEQSPHSNASTQNAANTLPPDGSHNYNVSNLVRRVQSTHTTTSHVASPSSAQPRGPVSSLSSPRSYRPGQPSARKVDKKQGQLHQRSQARQEQERVDYSSTTRPQQKTTDPEVLDRSNTQVVPGQPHSKVPALRPAESASRSIELPRWPAINYSPPHAAVHLGTNDIRTPIAPLASRVSPLATRQSPSEGRDQHPLNLAPARKSSEGARQPTYRGSPQQGPATHERQDLLRDSRKRPIEINDYADGDRRAYKRWARTTPSSENRLPLDLNSHSSEPEEGSQRGRRSPQARYHERPDLMRRVVWRNGRRVIELIDPRDWEAVVEGHDSQTESRSRSPIRQTIPPQILPNRSILIDQRGPGTVELSGNEEANARQQDQLESFDRPSEPRSYLPYSSRYPLEPAGIRHRQLPEDYSFQTPRTVLTNDYQEDHILLPQGFEAIRSSSRLERPRQQQRIMIDQNGDEWIAMPAFSRTNDHVLREVSSYAPRYQSYRAPRIEESFVEPPYRTIRAPSRAMGPPTFVDFGRDGRQVSSPPPPPPPRPPTQRAQSVRSSTAQRDDDDLWPPRLRPASLAPARPMSAYSHGPATVPRLSTEYHYRGVEPSHGVRSGSVQRRQSPPYPL